MSGFGRIRLFAIAWVCGLIADPCAANEIRNCPAKAVEKALFPVEFENPVRATRLPTGEILAEFPKLDVVLVRPQPSTVVQYVWSVPRREVTKLEISVPVPEQVISSHRATAWKNSRRILDDLIETILERTPPRNVPTWLPQGEIQLKSKAFFDRHQTSDVVLSIDRFEGETIAVTVTGLDRTYLKRLELSKNGLNAKGREIKTPAGIYVTLDRLIRQENIPSIPLASAQVARNQILAKHQRRMAPHRASLHLLASLFYPYKVALRAAHRVALRVSTKTPLLSGPLIGLPVRMLKADGAHLSIYLLLVFSGTHPILLGYRELSEREDGKLIGFDEWNEKAQQLEPLRNGPTVLLNGLSEDDFLKPAIGPMLTEGPLSRPDVVSIEGEMDYLKALSAHVAKNGLIHNLTVVGHGFSIRDPETGKWVRGFNVGGIRYVASGDVAARLEAANPGVLFASTQSFALSPFLAKNARVEFVSCQMGRADSGKEIAEEMGRQSVGPKGGAFVFSTFNIFPDYRSYTPQMAKDALQATEAERRYEASQPKPSAIEDFWNFYFVSMSPHKLGEILSQIRRLDPTDREPVQVIRFPVTEK